MYKTVVKKIADRVAAIFGLIFFFPLFVLIALFIKLDSPGPVFYLGTRIGFGGRPFRVYKFRSMAPDAEQRGSSATAQNDPRITRVGKFIRKYKIDELPQLINVIKGEMSIVGPRPEVEEHVKCYDDKEKIILNVLPGITDYASIHFINLGALLGDKDPNAVFIEKYRDEKNRLRMEYVKKQSFWVDIHILATTLIHLCAR